MNYVVRLLALATLWLLAWGEASLANVLSGIAVAAVLLTAFPLERTTASTIRPNPLGVARLLMYIVGQLVTSNVLVAREILARESKVRTGVLAYRVRHPSDEVIAFIANIIGLTPGTMTVEATREPAVVYVHFLLLDDLEEARHAIARLEDLVVAALGLPPHTEAVPAPSIEAPTEPDDTGGPA